MLSKLFVYGSLRTGSYNHDKHLIGKVKASEMGFIKGTLYHIENKGYPAIVDGEYNVYGELMEFYDHKSVINELDGLESYNHDNLEESEYIRKEVEVTLENGKVELGYVYMYNLNSSKNRNDILLKIDGNDWISYRNNL